ncbi:MAG: hypothetical protein ABFS03_10035 [Chloroflexota bacterium]
MKKAHLLLRNTLWAAVLIALIAALAIPAAPALAEGGKPPTVRLTIINGSQFEFSIYLYGPEQRFISVPAHATYVTLVSRNWYSFTMTACNHTEPGTLDLNMEQTIHVPVCGGRAFAPVYRPHHVDVADYIKPIRVKIRNQTGSPVDVYIRTLDEHHFLNLDYGEIQLAFLNKQQYVYSYYACGELYAGYYTPFVSYPFDVKCSK